MLFLKREAFSHENEWRVVLYGEGGDPTPTGMSVPVDANRLIDSLLVDPRANRSELELVTRAFRDVGYIGRIKRSALYEPPEPVLVN